MKLSLVVLSTGKAEGQKIAIPVPQFIVGRDPQCQLRPASPIISKKHCALLQRGGKAYIKDFQSTNGTFVNDEKVEGERELQNNDIIKIGPLLFRVVLEAGTPVDKPTPLPASIKAGDAAPAALAANKPSAPTRAAPDGLTPVATRKKPAPEDQPPALVDDLGVTTPAPDAVSSLPDNEDDIAAMLLSLQEGEGSGGSTQEVPSGTTVFELPAVVADPQATKAEPGKTPPPPNADKKPPGKKEEKANTSAAAAAILAKYARRPRNNT